MHTICGACPWSWGRGKEAPERTRGTSCRFSVLTAVCVCVCAQRWAEVMEHHQDIMPRVQGYLEGMMHSIEQEVRIPRCSAETEAKALSVCLCFHSIHPSLFVGSYHHTVLIGHSVL